MSATSIRFVPLIAAVLFSGCNNKESKSGAEGNPKPVIAATNYPLAFFAERLAGDFADIVFDAPADEDPAFWSPTDDQIATMQGADLILMNGATYEKWAATTTLPFKAVVCAHS